MDILLLLLVTIIMTNGQMKLKDVVKLKFGTNSLSFAPA